MDFNDTPEQAEFRQSVKTWLAANATPASGEKSLGGQEDSYEKAKSWYKKMADAGYACLAWPKEYGGGGLSAIHSVIWSQEVAAYDEPDGYFVIGQGNCGPALMAFSDEQTKLDLLPRMASAEDVWCQLFSEPSAGSDVAGLRTRAEKDGDNWKVNGQKIWTSGAQHSDFGVILTRTDPTVSKYRGLTMFMIDMKQPGVEVKPIKQMDGGAHFNEVFFNDAVIPDSYRLGEVGGGWGGALTVLMNERLANAGAVPNGFDVFYDFVRKTELDGEPIANDPLVRDQLAELYTKAAGLKAIYYRQLTAVSKGGIPGAEGSLGKLVGAKMNQDSANFMLDVIGQGGVIRDADLSLRSGHFQHTVLFSPGVRLAGGTDEIMRNIISEQVLGLPQEPRADKGMAFNEIPTGGS